MRRSSAEAPLLVVPMLRGDDGVNGTTVSYLLQLAKKEKESKDQKEKELKKEKKLEAATSAFWASADFQKERKKKRRTTRALWLPPRSY